MSEQFVTNAGEAVIDVKELNRIKPGVYTGRVEVDLPNGDSFSETGDFTSEHFAELGILFT